MCNLEDFMIENGVLKKYRGPGGDVFVPKSVTKIDTQAFYRCSSLTSITIPDSVTEIGFEAFEHCSNLKNLILPENMKTICSGAFEGCSSLTSIKIPGGITEIAYGTFHNCKSLTTITIPDSVTKIDADAFSDCSSLRNLILPKKLKTIGSNSFLHCDKLKITVPDALFKNGATMPVEILEYSQKPSTELLPYILMNQQTREWRKYVQRREDNFDRMLQTICDAIRDLGKLHVSQVNHIIAYLQENKEQVSAENLRPLYQSIKECCPKGAEKITDIAEFRTLVSDCPQHPVEALARSVKMLNHVEIPNDLLDIVKNGVLYSDKTAISTIEAVVVPVAMYANYFKEHCSHIRSSMETMDRMIEQLDSIPEFIPEADKVAELLDSTALSSFLFNQLKRGNYRTFMLAFARYGTEEDIEKFVKEIATKSRGRAKEKYWAENARYALYLSDTRAAGYYFDGIGELEEYAKLRGLTKNEYRDARMLPSFGMDSDGMRIFESGGTKIRVTISDDLTLQFYDLNSDRMLKSFPKAGIDDKCLDEFNQMNTELKDFIKQREAVLMRMYWDGETITMSLWKNAYLTHPVLRRIAQLLIWQDERGETFTVFKGEIINALGNAYVPGVAITLAHVLDMETAQILSWQNFLMNNNQKQLFNQIWEPVCLTKEKLAHQKHRYQGAVISQKERNAFKKKMKSKGIPVSSDPLDKKYDIENERYIFSNENNMRIGSHITLGYTIDEKSKDITFGTLSFSKKQGLKELNTLIYELDILTIQHQIALDRAEILEDPRIANFTIAQINELLQYAIDNKATYCSAALMEYKNRNFDYSTAMDIFTLE